MSNQPQNGEERAAEMAIRALVAFETYNVKHNAVPSWSTARGPMSRKLARLYSDAVDALANLWDFDEQRARRVWRDAAPSLLLNQIPPRART